MRKAFALLFVLIAAAYAGSFRAGWHLDDNRTIVRNEAIDDLPRAFSRLVTANRGLGDLTFTLNHRIAGDDPFLYHGVNLAIHFACGILIYLLVSGLRPKDRRTRRAAFAAAALFLAHPLATGSVTYVVQRYTSLATLFYLLSVWLYRRGAVRGDRTAAVLSVLAALAGARSKEIVLTLPAALLLLEWLFPTMRTRRRYLRALPHAAVVALIPLTLVTARIGLGESLADAMTRSSRETGVIGRSSYAITEVHVVTDYLRLLFLPRGLTIDHDVPVRTDPFEAATLLKGIFLAACIGAGFALRRWRPLAAFGILWFFLALSVESSLLPIRDVMFEHRTYLPSVGFFSALAALLPDPRGRPRLAAGALAAVLVLLSALTFERNRVWRSEISLWSDAVRKAPAKARPWANLGYARLEGGEREGAAAALEEAVRLGPVFPEDLVTLAEARYGLGRYREAEEALREAIRILPRYARAHRNLALLLRETGRPDEALREAERAVEVDPAYEEGRRFLAVLRAEREAGAGKGIQEETGALAAALEGDGKEALRRMKTWEADEGPKGPDDAVRIARALHEGGMPEEALEALLIAGRMFPGDARFPYYAGAILYQRGDPAEALPRIEESLERDPSDGDARLLLARALIDLNQPARARIELERILGETPQLTEAKELLSRLP
ncbi:MAG: tetratricopeptide repeat protein [Candidatus Eisenbacteria bacterium]